jgi:hypothetical protein
MPWGADITIGLVWKKGGKIGSGTLPTPGNTTDHLD